MSAVAIAIDTISQTAFLSSYVPAGAQRQILAIQALLIAFAVLNGSDHTAAELRNALPAHRQRVVHVCPPGVDADS